MTELSLSEELVLWAIWRLGDNAYGVTIRRHMSQATLRIYPYGTLYGTLAKLVRRGFATKTVGEPEAVRGGRSKNFYRITAAGLNALKDACELKKALWNTETESALGNK